MTKIFDIADGWRPPRMGLGKGLSPPARGNLGGVIGKRRVGGSIPARAGEPSQVYLVAFRSAVYHHPEAALSLNRA